MTDWHRRFYMLAHTVSEYSKNRKAKVGAVIYNPATHAILSIGYNGLPRGMDDTCEEYHQKPLKKYLWEHAERNAIFNAASHGISTRGMGIALNWYPCADCARAMIQSGLEEVVLADPDWSDTRWAADWQAARHILEACGIRVIFFDNGSESGGVEEPFAPEDELLSGIEPAACDSGSHGRVWLLPCLR